MDLLALVKPQAENTVYVMRHGRTILDDMHRSDGWLDYPLSDEGRKGILTAQRYLKEAPIKTVYSSSLTRTAETAHILASGILSEPKQKIADEARTWNLGVLIGGKKKSNKPIVTFYMDHPDEVPHKGESLTHFHERFIPWLFARLKDANRGEGAILVVTSGSNLREIGRALTGDVDSFDLDEGGLLALTMAQGIVRAQVLFGHKDADSERWS